MSTVATSLVATVMNANFSALTTASLSTSATQEFSSVLEQVNSSETSGGSADMKAETMTAEQPQTQEMTGGDPVEDPVQQGVHEKPVEEMSEEELTEMKEAMEAVKGESADMKGITDTQEAETMIDEALTEISELLDMSEEELESLMEEMNIDLLDFHDPTVLSSVIQEVYSLETPAEILVDENAAEAFMEVAEVIDTLEENLGVEDLAGLRDQLAVMQTGGEQAVDVDAQVQEEAGGESLKPLEPQAEGLGGDKATEFEVVDLRVKEADTGGGQEQSGGQQGQSFGEFMSDQLNQIKDMAVDVKAEVVDYQQVSIEEVIDQIVTKAAITVEVDKTSMTMQLNPEHLGKVAVSVTAEQGMIKGEFVAENQQVKEMLEASMVQLKQQLEEQGIKVDKIEVALGSTNQFYDQSKGDSQQEQQSGKQSGSRIGRISRMMNEDLTELADVTDLRDNFNQTSVLEESTVEYSA